MEIDELMDLEVGDFIYRLKQGWTYAHIAGAFGYPEEAVRRAVARKRAKFRRAILSSRKEPR